MKIIDVLCVPVRTGFFTDDQAAIRAGAVADGAAYGGDPVTPGFAAVREAGEALSVLLVLQDGQVAQGDCAAVQYSGVGGREPLFRAAAGAEVIGQHVAPLLLDASVDSFRGLAERVDTHLVDGVRLPAAVRYGVTQALLDATARARHVTMAEVIRDEYATGIEIAVVPMFVQSGDDRYSNVDKMILKRADVLPHGLINHIDKLGSDGSVLLGYAGWVRDRVLELGPQGYHPLMHFDLYGTLGEALGGDIEATADYLVTLEQAVKPFGLRVEHPIDAGSREAQISAFKALRAALRERSSAVQLSVDEWCNTLDDIRAFVAAGAADVIHVKTPDLGGINNTIEALLLVRTAGLAAFCGGTCNETDHSAQVSAQVAMACDAAQVLAKPGMGVDEGMMIVGNEMARTAALVARRERGTQ